MPDVTMTRSQFKAYERLLKVIPHTVEPQYISVEVTISDEPGGWEEVETFPACVVEVPEDCPEDMWPCSEDDMLEVDWELLAAFPGMVEALEYAYRLDAEFAAADAYTRRAEQGFCNY